MNPRSKMTDATAIWEFLMAGKSTFTLVSLKTGKRFTYRARRYEHSKKTFVSVLFGPDNLTDYGYIGWIMPDSPLTAGRTAKISMEAESAVALAWFWRMIDQKNTMPTDLLEVWHSGRCGRCNRKLTVPESIRTGLGPECAGRVLKAERVERRRAA